MMRTMTTSSNLERNFLIGKYLQLELYIILLVT